MRLITIFNSENDSIFAFDQVGANSLRRMVNFKPLECEMMALTHCFCCWFSRLSLVVTLSAETGLCWGLCHGRYDGNTTGRPTMVVVVGFAENIAGLLDSRIHLLMAAIDLFCSKAPAVLFFAVVESRGALSRRRTFSSTADTPVPWATRRPSNVRPRWLFDYMSKIRSLQIRWFSKFSAAKTASRQKINFASTQPG